MNCDEEVVAIIESLYIDCPECQFDFGDDQKTCTTCWGLGGGGRIHVLTFIKENQDYFL